MYNIKINLDCDFSNKKWSFRWILNNKILFRTDSKEEFNKKMKEIETFFSESGLLQEEHTKLPFKIRKDKILKTLLFSVLQGEDKINFEVKADCLTSPLSKARFVSSYYLLPKKIKNKLILSLDSKERNIYNFLYILFNKSNILKVNKPWFFKEILEAYAATKKWFEDSKIKITNLDNIKAPNYLLEDWTHRVLALLKILEDYKTSDSYFTKYNLETVILNLFSNLILEESKMIYNNSYYSVKDLKPLNIKELDETPKNLHISKYLFDRNM